MDISDERYNPLSQRYRHQVMKGRILTNIPLLREYTCLFYAIYNSLRIQWIHTHRRIQWHFQKVTGVSI